MPSIRREAFGTDSPEHGAKLSAACRLKASASLRAADENQAPMPTLAVKEGRLAPAGPRMFLGTADLWKTAESRADREAEDASGISPTYTPIRHQTAAAAEICVDELAVRRARPTALIRATGRILLDGTPVPPNEADTKQVN